MSHRLPPLLPVLSITAMFFAPGSTGAALGAGTTPLTAGNLTMVSTHADGTSGTPASGIEGANQVAIDDDGTAVAFVSDVPAQNLVTDPVQLARGVTDHNSNVGTTHKGDDVFLYLRPSGTGKPIISLVSQNGTGTGTGNAPSEDPTMAPHGLGLVFQSGATDLVSGHVDANQNHLYAWVPGLGSVTGEFLIDTKVGSSDACDCAATDPSISLFPRPTVVFTATGSLGNELLSHGVKGQDQNQVYAHDVKLGTNTLVSVTDDSTVPSVRSATTPDIGNGAVGGASEPSIASDAPIVVFQAPGNDLVDGFVNSHGANIWARNLTTGTTSLVSRSVTGSPDGTSGNENPVLGAAGTSVAWDSNGSDVSSTPVPAGPAAHVYFSVIQPGGFPTVLVDTDWTGSFGCNSGSSNPGISGDGRSVIFQSTCSDITQPVGSTPDNNGAPDVFDRTVAPLAAPTPRLLSVNDTGGGAGNGGSQLCAPSDGDFNFPCSSSADSSASVNSNGSVVTFFSVATDIARPAQGTPPFNDGSVIESYPTLASGVRNVLVSGRPDGAYADNSAGDAVVSRNGCSVAFLSNADNLVPNDTNNYFDAFTSEVHNQGCITSRLSVTATPGLAVYGQTVLATATVSVTSGTPSGAVQFAVDGVSVGAPVPVGSAGGATSGGLTGPGGAALPPGPRVISASFTPSDTSHTYGSRGQTNLLVNKAATTTSVVVSAHALRASVAAVAPGRGQPAGTIIFSVDGGVVGSVPVSAGAATLVHTIPVGMIRHVAAAYSGDVNFLPSSASTARHDPGITARVSSAHRETNYGWYRSPVTVSFTCTANGAPLGSACPEAVTLSHNGAAQTVSRTISATDGGIATATVQLNIDRSAPKVSVRGVRNGGRYASPGPRPHCHASDALSGVATCKLTRHRSGSTVRYTATATDKAGNLHTTRGSYHLRP